jgi:hypothetical protein
VVKSKKELPEENISLKKGVSGSKSRMKNAS